MIEYLDAGKHIYSWLFFWIAWHKKGRFDEEHCFTGTETLRRIEEHLAGCQECREKLKKYCKETGMTIFAEAA
ncbi:MAG: hypothetical protein PHY72_02570 [Candidatus Pacebacteria bacterium]|nr:hypothetical protein [Candidatus Paceibacterota bacterium]